MTCRICGFASIVAADVTSRRPLSSLVAGAALCGGFMMLGGALNTPGLVPAAGGACSVGGGTLGGRPGGLTNRGGGTPATHLAITVMTLNCREWKKQHPACKILTDEAW